MLPLLFKVAWFWFWDFVAVVDGALSPGFGMPLEAEEEPLSFFPDDDFPPLGMRLVILEAFLVESTGVSRSSLEGQLSLEYFPDLLLSSLSLHGAVGRLPLAEAFEYEGELFEDEVLLDAGREDAGVFVGICLDVTLLLPLQDSGPVGTRLSSPYSDRSSSSWRAISAIDGDALEADRGLMRRNFSSIDLWGGATPDPTLDPSLPCC